MIVKDLKMAYRLVKYGHEIKKFLCITVMLVGLGVVMACTNDLIMGTCGALIMMSAPTMLLQSFMGVNMLRVVQSSPKAKYLQTLVVSTVIVGLELLGYLFSILTMLFLVATGVMPIRGVGPLCLLICGFGAFTMIYYICSYRFYIVSTVIYFLCFFGAFIGVERNMTALEKLQISVPVAFGIGIVVFVLMWFVVRLLAELLLKYPMDVKALGVAGKTLLG